MDRGHPIRTFCQRGSRVLRSGRDSDSMALCSKAQPRLTLPAPKVTPTVFHCAFSVTQHIFFLRDATPLRCQLTRLKGPMQRKLTELRRHHEESAGYHTPALVACN
eukprot:scaffold48_cov395-Prasinococcus_capsulatus_cf.AAC.45